MILILQRVHLGHSKRFTCVVRKSDRHHRLIGVRLGRNDSHLSISRIVEAVRVPVPIYDIAFVQSVLQCRPLQRIQDIEYRQRDGRLAGTVPVAGVPCREGSGFKFGIRYVTDDRWAICVSDGMIGG